MWLHAWVDNLDGRGPQLDPPQSFRLTKNAGRGLAITGTREWTDYRVATTLTPHLAAACGLAARVQGLHRYYALILHQDGLARLVKAVHAEVTLAEASVAWELGRPYALSLAVEGARIRAQVDGKLLFDVVDSDRPLEGGGIALVCEEGSVTTDAVSVTPI
jgi:hypothetical protein